MRPIDADELKRLIGIEDAVKYGNETEEQLHNSYATLMNYEIADYIDDMPTIDYAPVRRGEWWRDVWEDETIEPHKMRYAGYRCSRCYFGTAMKRPYCPNCGAKMDGKEDGEDA